MIAIRMKIDWPLLREQKRWLIAHQDAADEAPVEGLLGLIDHIQDSAVADGLAEEEVFGTILKD